MEHSQRRWHRQPDFYHPASRANKGGFPPSTLYGKEARSAGSEAITAGNKKLTRPRGQNVVTVYRTFINTRDYTAEWGRPVTRQAV